MAKNGSGGISLNGILLGAALGAGALYLIEHLKGFSFSLGSTPATPPVNYSTGQSPVASSPAPIPTVQSHVGILPGDELPFYDKMDDSAPRGSSNVWDRRTTEYRNDGILYNTIGKPIFSNGTTDFHPEHRLSIAGVYGNDLDDGPRPRQEHAGGRFPECLKTAGEYSC